MFVMLCRQVAVDQRCGGVNAVVRDDAVVRFQIGRRKADGVAASVAADDDALDAVRPAEHPAGKIDSSLGQSLANPRRAYPSAREAGPPHLVRDKPKLTAHLPKQIDIAAAVLAERKAFAEIDLLRVQAVANDIGQKSFGRLRRQTRGRTG